MVFAGCITIIRSDFCINHPRALTYLERHTDIHAIEVHRCSHCLLEPALAVSFQAANR